MSESALSKSTLIEQFKEQYNRKQTLLLENPTYSHLHIANYADKYKECSLIHGERIDFGSYGEIYECHIKNDI